MDERFLSKSEVIRASRGFICVRMMTYESASEAEVLKALWRPGAALENTVFAILDPQCRVILRGGRGPNMVFRDSLEMAKSMNEIASYYSKNTRLPQGLPQSLPAIDTVRLAIDVAACDHRPLAIVVGRTDEERNSLAANLAPLAWSDDLIGKLVYTTSKGNDLSAVGGASVASGYIFVAPNTFGTQASTIAQLGSSASRRDLELAARQAIASFHPQILEHHNHMFQGRQRGIEWQTAIPVTDPHALQAKQHERSGRSPMHGSGFSGPPGPPGGFDD